jgi:hypothetical protein
MFTVSGQVVIMKAVRAIVVVVAAAASIHGQARIGPPLWPGMLIRPSAAGELHANIISQ